MRSIINEKNLKNKKILLRLDLNVPINRRKITDTTRVDKILPTLNFLIKEKAKIIILSHVGRPKGKTDRELSLEPICKELQNKYPNLIVVSNQSSTFNKVLNKVKRNHNLFLVDPNGNVILGYNENFEGKKLLKDIKKLLKLSKIG